MRFLTPKERFHKNNIMNAIIFYYWCATATILATPLFCYRSPSNITMNAQLVPNGKYISWVRNEYDIGKYLK
jgi:hypothetical protein